MASQYSSFESPRFLLPWAWIRFAVQSQKAVTAYFSCGWLLPSGIAEQHCRRGKPAIDTVIEFVTAEGLGTPQAAVVSHGIIQSSPVLFSKSCQL